MDSDNVTTDVFDALHVAFARDAENPAVCVVDGFGASVTTSSCRLIVKDGIGRHRRTRTYARATHGLARLVVLARSGSVSLDAVQWLDGAGVAWCALGPACELLACSARAATDDVRILRAQALAMGTTTGLEISRRLVELKLSGQASVARKELGHTILAADIDAIRERLAESATLRSSANSRLLRPTSTGRPGGRWSRRS